MASRAEKSRRRTADRYVRPPIVAREPRPRWVVVWRFRLVALLGLAVLALVVLYIARNLINTEQNPSFGTMRAQASIVLAR